VTAPHFFVETYDRLRPGDDVLLSPEDSAHALRSRRMRPGEPATVSNNRSWLGRGRLKGEQGGHAVIELVAVSEISPRHPQIDISLAPPKGERLTWAVQKLSELGVYHLDLMETERSIRQPSAGTLSRLAVVAREAAMQSAQPVIMDVSDRGELRENLTAVDGVGVMLHEAATERLSDVLREDPNRVHVLVGPEGGFSYSEVSRARDAGFSPVTLGPSILRTETAAVVGAALVLARYGRLG
jgi:16S rRNA (uracil1498-N3)-methyltransferase